MDIGFYYITDSSGKASGVKAALDAGAKVVQYREKDLPARTMLDEARRLRELCRGRALFIVNDRVDIALAVNADGVHLGQDPYSEAS
jgi:thiamine-phosphate pyrophosphorylase